MILIILSPHFINRTLLQSSRINVYVIEGAWIMRLEPLTVFGSATSVIILWCYLMICLACLIFSDDSSSVKIQICYAVFKSMYSVMPTLLLPPSLHLLSTKAVKLPCLYFVMEVTPFLSLTIQCQLFILKFNSNHHHCVLELKSLFLWPYRLSNTFLWLFYDIFKNVMNVVCLLFVCFSFQPVRSKRLWTKTAFS